LIIIFHEIFFIIFNDKFLDFFVFFVISKIFGDWGLGIGDWGLGVGGWGPNPKTPTPKPKTPPPKKKKFFLKKKFYRK